MIEVYETVTGYEDIEMECFFTVDLHSYTCMQPFKLKQIAVIQ